MFMWQRDNKYELTGDMKEILRIGDDLETYDPETDEDVSCHVIFATLHTQVIGNSDERSPKATKKRNAFFAEKFKSEEEAAFGFISRYGFLGLGPEGAKARIERVGEILDLQELFAESYKLDQPVEKMTEELLSEMQSSGSDYFLNSATYKFEVFSDVKGNFSGYYRPANLLSYMIDKLLHDMMEETILRECIHCTCPFVVKKKDYKAFKHKSLAYCSNNCRVSKYLAQRKRSNEKQKGKK